MSATPQLRVLLVEDNVADARLIAELLSEVPGRNFTIEAVGSLREGLARRDHADVVLLDLSLPDAHRLETVEQMTSGENAVPIVVLTGLADDETAQQAVHLGAQDYLSKQDITPALLARTILYAIERKRAEEHALAAKSAWRAEVLASVSGVLASSLDLNTLTGHFVHALSPALADVALLDLAEPGASLTRYAVAAESAEREAELRALANGPLGRDPLSVPGRALRAAASIGWLGEQNDFGLRSVIALPLVPRDHPIGVLTLGFREKRRRTLDDEHGLRDDLVRRAALAIENARLYHTAQAAIRARDEVVAVVSHDLRNPLNVIGLSLQVLAPTVSADAARRAVLGRAQRAHERMTRLLEDLLDITSIEQGKLGLDLKPVALDSLLWELVDLQRPIAVDKGVQLEAVLGEARVELPLDRDRIGQLMSNLIGNAIKFTPAGGRIAVRAERSETSVAVVISDSGPGIEPELLPHVFDRFWQAKNRPRSGIGLGLAICKGIVEAHGGSIHALSEPGRGATIRFELPISQAVAS